MRISDWFEPAVVLLILFCIFWWIWIGLKKLVYMFQGKCPKGRICMNPQCKVRSWCTKYQRHADVYKSVMESIREANINERRKQGNKE